MSATQWLCVFCGSSRGRHSVYGDAALELAKEMAARGIGLVYGGGNVGLMGVLAETVMGGGGQVIGVIPEALVERELLFRAVTKIHVVPNMHQRKELMYQCSDGFVAMPGGLGTMDELFEIVTWAQLGFHSKPIALFNIDGYFDPLLQMLDRMVEEGFVSTESRQLITTADSVESALSATISGM